MIRWARLAFFRLSEAQPCVYSAFPRLRRGLRSARHFRGLVVQHQGVLWMMRNRKQFPGCGCDEASGILPPLRGLPACLALSRRTSWRIGTFSPSPGLMDPACKCASPVGTTNDNPLRKQWVRTRRSLPKPRRGARIQIQNPAQSLHVRIERGYSLCCRGV